MPKYCWDEKIIRECCRNATSYCEVLRLMHIPIHGSNSQTLKNKIKKYQIDISHFTGRAKSYTSASIDQYLVKDSNIKSAKLKEKLLINRLKENKYEICGITTWQEKPIVIQLHHINGNPTDNRIENLQMLCPNCHSQTENYARKESINKPKNVCLSCGKQIGRNSTYCKSCAAKYRNNNLEIPSRETLKELLLIKSFTKIGETYGVTDNAVRKWCKKYNLPFRKKDIIKP